MKCQPILQHALLVARFYFSTDLFQATSSGIKTIEQPIVVMIDCETVMKEINSCGLVGDTTFLLALYLLCSLDNSSASGLLFRRYHLSGCFPKHSEFPSKLHCLDQDIKIIYSVLDFRSRYRLIGSKKIQVICINADTSLIGQDHNHNPF